MLIDKSVQFFWYVWSYVDWYQLDDQTVGRSDGLTVRQSDGRTVGWLVSKLVGWSVGRSVGEHESKSVNTRISAPAHPSATGGRVSGLV